MGVARTQALIVGGGPAGLAAAIALGRRKIDCVLVDSLSQDVDKACGEGLMPDTLASLAALGVVVSPADGYTMQGISFMNESDHVRSTFPDGEGVGVRRPWFRQKMAQAATDAGSQILWNTRIKITSANTARIDGRELRFDWLIGADGTSSAIRTAAGLSTTIEEHHRYAVRRHYRVKPWSGFVELHWNRTGQVCLAPVGDECVSAIFMTNSRETLRGDPFAAFPELMSRLKDTEMMTTPAGAVLMTRRLRQVARGNTALVGDASGSVDAITGEGLGMSFRQAAALADCIHSGSLAGYNRRHRAIGRLPHLMGRVLLLLDQFPTLANSALAALSQCPESFAAMLNLHIGAASAGQVLARQAPRFAVTLLASLAKQGIRSMSANAALPELPAIGEPAVKQTP